MENGATDMVGLNHGNAWSVYFDDPENNKVAVYVDTPFHTPQPCGEPLHLDLSEADLLAETKDRKSGVSGTSVSARVDFGGRRCYKKIQTHSTSYSYYT